MKRCIIWFLACVMVLSLAACAGNKGGKSGEEALGKTGTTVLDPDTELSIVIGSHSSWPYDENFMFWKYFREAVGGNIKVTAIPGLEFPTKLSLMMASPDELPDLVHMIVKLWADEYAATGALVSIDDYLDIMPNYTAFWDTVPEEEREAMFIERRSADGKMYYPPVYGYGRVDIPVLQCYNTYKLENGVRRFILEDGETPSAKYGTLTYGLYQRADPGAVDMVSHSDEAASMIDFALDCLESNSNPKYWLAFNPDEADVIKDIGSTLETFVNEQLSKFLLGQEPMSKWDAFVAEIEEIGVDKLLTVYTSALNRVKK